jgi:hypothetical protein
MSPPLSPPASFSTLGDYLVDLSPASLTVAPSQVCDLLRVAFRFWVTELRPLWMARRCHREMLTDQDCVLLARIEFDVDFVGGSPAGAWQIVGSPAAVVVDERTRPFIVHLRLLQEWLMCGCDCGGLGAAQAQGGGGSIFLANPLGGSGGAPRRVPVATTGANLTLDDGHYCVICAGAANITIALPASGPATAGRVYVVRNADVTKVTVKPDGGSTIDDKPTLLVKKATAVTIVADGAGAWHLIGLAG